MSEAEVGEGGGGQQQQKISNAYIMFFFFPPPPPLQQTWCYSVKTNGLVNSDCILATDYAVKSTSSQ